MADKNTTLPSLNLYPFPALRLNRRCFRFRRSQITTQTVGYGFRGLRTGFSGDQIVVDILVSAVETALVDDLAAGTKTMQVGGRFASGFVVVEKGVDHRMPVKKRNGFGTLRRP